MSYHITLIKGDGIGPEVIASAVRCIEASGIDVDWQTMPAGQSAQKKYKSVLPKETLDSIKENKLGLKGPITTPIGKGFRSVNVAIRQELDLFANVRPAKTIPGIVTPFKNVDLVVIRENTEDLYTGIEYQNGSPDARKLVAFIKKTNKAPIRSDTGISIKPISSFATKRITEYAFGYAQRHKRKKITAVHKANIMKYTDGLFLSTSSKVATRHRGVAFEDRIVDNMCMQLVQNPEEFDMLLCPNLYGDIISDLCSGLIGGLGLAASADVGHKCAVFEPVHGSAPKYTGKNKVNPTAAILSAVMLLRHMREEKAANKIENAVHAVIKEGKHVTYDIAKGKSVGTSQMTDAIISRMK